MRELALLQHIYAGNAALPPRVTLGPGDDMGEVIIGGARVLVTVDQIADGVHFRLGDTPLEKVARKAITRNLSDVAAMGAVPSAAVVAGCLPRGFGEAQANALTDAMQRVAMQYDCPLIGGDISIWDHPLLLSVTVLAEGRGVDPVLRRGARTGDVVCVTGALGGSLVTLPRDGYPNGYTHHLDFEPRLAVARKLASDGTLRPNCMIDLSDGLGKDLAHLCRAGDEGRGLSTVVSLDALPISDAARIAAKASGKPAWQHAVGDGEDYELCFTLSPAAAAELPAMIAGVAITRIGTMIPREPAALILMEDAAGKQTALGEAGWEHHD